MARMGRVGWNGRFATPALLRTKRSYLSSENVILLRVILFRLKSKRMNDNFVDAHDDLILLRAILLRAYIEQRNK